MPDKTTVAGELPELPAPLEIDWPELNSHALGCGVEDRDLYDRYDCAEYGWQDGVDRAAQCVPDDIYDADQMRAYATAALAQKDGEIERLKQMVRQIYDAASEDDSVKAESETWRVAVESYNALGSQA